MRRFAIPALSAGLILAVGCGDISGPSRATLITELPRDLTVSERAVIDGSNAFALGLLTELRTLAPDSPNTFISPLSASMALGMTMNGAEGQTWTQMRDVLGFAGLEEPAINEAYRSLIDLLLSLDGAVEIGLGNAIWVDEVELLAGFVDRTETYFDAEVDRLDFDDPASADVMNGWVDSVTHGRIPKLLDRVDPDALLYLINAIYFNGGWRHTFDADRTAEASFQRLDGTTVSVPMMAGEIGYRTLNAGNPGAVQGVELPYAGGAFTAVVLLPPQATPIDEWVAGLDGGTWADWMDHFDSQFTGEDPDGEGLL
ncbi:MAG: serpin family protein, partial [Longimicrobiales bacterium]|nr:serpin family protein [Longimicrobiales bacterium]